MIVAAILGLALLAAMLIASTHEASSSPLTPSSYSIWPNSVVPRVPADSDTNRVEVGTRFRVSQAGYITHLRFYKSSQNSGPQVGKLWSSSGKLLARATFPTSSGAGWRTVALATPVPVPAGSEYVVSYLAPAGRYADDVDVFANGAAVKSHALTAYRGVYSYGGGFPTQTWRNSNYYVDVVFATNETSPTSPAATTSQSSEPVTGPTSTAPPKPSPTRTGTQTSPPTQTETLTPTETLSPTVPTASATPTLQSNGSVPLGCAGRPSSCGYPDSTNTGPTSGTSFAQVPAEKRSGSGWTWSDNIHAVIVSGAGATLNALDVSGQVVIDAPNVTISNSRIAACGGSDDNDVIAVRYKGSDSSYRGSNARIIRNRIIGTPSGCSVRARSGVRDIYGEAPSMLVDGNDISGTGNGITTEYSATVINNWVHDLGHIAGDHHSGISTHGGAQQITVRHNTVLLYGQKFAGGGGVSGALTVYADFDHAQNVTAQDNLISGGSYVVYGGNSGDAYRTPSTNVKFLNNRFVCGDWLYGPVAAFSSSSSGNEWSGNYCDQTGLPVK